MVLTEVTTGLNESSGMGSHIALVSSGDQETRRQSLLSVQTEKGPGEDTVVYKQAERLSDSDQVTAGLEIPAFATYRQTILFFLIPVVPLVAWVTQKPLPKPLSAIPPQQVGRTHGSCPQQWLRTTLFIPSQ